MKLKTNIIYILLLSGISLIFLFNSCKKDEYSQITDAEEAEWMPYKKNDKLIFISTQGAIDTFKVIEKIKAYRDGYNEYIDAPITLVADTVGGEEVSGGVFLYKTSSGLSVTVRLPHYYQFEEITAMPLQYYTVNGLVYSDVIIMVSNPLLLDNDTYVDSMFYSKKYGFIRYTDKNGESWSISN